MTLICMITSKGLLKILPLMRKILTHQSLVTFLSIFVGTVDKNIL